MEAVREIISADMLLPIMNLPWKSKDMQVEVIVMPYMEKTPQQRKIDFRKLKGCLKEYANPALWEEEEHAWENHVIEKYGNI